MPTLYLLTHAHDAIRVLHAGKRLVTGEGDDAIVQNFASEEAAAAHLEYMLQRRRRDGYRVQTSELADAGEIGEVDPLAGVVQWDERGRRATVTFKSFELAPRQSAAVVERCASLEARCVHVVCDPASPGTALSEALTRRPLPSVERFVFDTHFQTPARQRANSLGDLTDALAALPSLELAFVTGASTLRPTTHVELRALYLVGDPLPHEVLRALGKSRLPRLGRLGLELHSEGGLAAEDLLPGALRGLHAPLLTTLAVTGLGDLPRFLADLCAAGPLPPAWSRLNLDGVVDDEEALLAALRDHADALARLEVLGLPLSDALSSAAAETAARLVRAVVDREELPEALGPATYETW